MLVKLMLDSIPSWHAEEVILLPKDSTEENIKNAFKKIFDIEYNKYECTYEILPEEKP